MEQIKIEIDREKVTMWEPSTDNSENTHQQLTFVLFL